ncbi:Hypothetical protein D9617_3g021410 [Elsinoe fawcettii]|nr:Hypothetical protein D9617_3g021410 [Elsinoe fawcettii]
MALIQSAAVEEGKQALDLYQALYQVVSWYKADSTFDNFEIMEMRGLVRSRYDNWLQWLEKSDSQAYQKLNRKNEHSRSMSDLPRHHGNRNDQWHQQPAGTIFQLIHGQDPISTERIRPIMMSSKTIDPELVDIVNEHIREGERTYSLTKVSPYLDDGDVQLNSLGFRVQKDVRTGKRKVTETYYGHGSGHLERLKRRKMGAAAISRPPPTPAPPAQQNNPMPNPPAAAVNMPTPPPPVLQQTNRIASDLHPTRAAGAPPPPPPPTATAASPPFPFQLPPRPPNWTGLWPPPPPGGNMAGAPPPPPPPSASHSPPNGAYGYQRGDSHGHSGGYDRSHYGPRDSFHGGTPRGRGGYGRGRGHW